MPEKTITFKSSGKKTEGAYDKKFVRMMTLLRMLNDGETVTRPLAKEMFGCAVKTVDRYLDTMRTAGFDIYFDPHANDMHGSYKLQEGFSTARAGMTDEEALTFGIAREMMAKIGKKSERVMESIGNKMQAGRFTLPPHIVISGNNRRPEVEEHFKRLDYAIVNHNKVKMTYVYSGGRKEDAVIEPYYLFLRDGVWHLRAHSKKIGKPRLYVLDNIKTLEVLDDEYFLPNAEISPEELRDSREEQAPGEDIEVVLRVGSEFASDLKRYKMHRKQEEKMLSDGRLEVTFRTKGNKAVRLWKYSLLQRMRQSIRGI